MGFLKSTFKHKLGAMARSKTTKLQGIINNRAEALYGCNRYYVQPQVVSDMKIPDGYWMDEDDIEIVEQVAEKNNKKTGGPMSKVR